MAKINVIVADDEKLFRTGLISLFKNSDIQVIGEAENGNELLSLLKSKKTEIVLLDLEMPVMNGSKTLNVLRKQYPELKVMILSKYYDEQLIKDVFNRGASAYISKNSAVELLSDAIRRVAMYGIYKDNIPCLLKSPVVKDGHYYKLMFTKRELGIVDLLCQAKSYKQIGTELFISEKTVENHAKSIFKKVSVKSRSEFGIFATRQGLNYLG